MKTKKKKTLRHHVVHHTKRVYHLTPKFVHGMVAGAFVGIILVASLRAGTANALSISSPRDCDTNAVINCGALTTNQLQSRYSYKGVSDIYNYFGISADAIKNIGDTAVAGYVGKDGTVTANGKVVATGAVTAGRAYIKGSTKVKSGSTTFYKRATSVSFRSASLAAFVAMKDGQFQFAILGACGNPVMATAVKPTPAPPTPPVTPPAGSTQTPPSVPTTTTASTTPTQLPNTGPGALVIIAVLSIAGGYIFHMTHRHVRRKRAHAKMTHHARRGHNAHA